MWRWCTVRPEARVECGLAAAREEAEESARRITSDMPNGPYLSHSRMPSTTERTIALKQPPTLPIGFAPRCGLDLAPIPALPGAIGGIAALAHQALETSRLGYAQQR